MTVRYVISDPSTFLYFDRRRPVNDQNSNYNYQYIADRQGYFQDDDLDIITCTVTKCNLNYGNPNVFYNPNNLKLQSFDIPNESWNDWQVSDLKNTTFLFLFIFEILKLFILAIISIVSNAIIIVITL